jgi:hypothetical protein
VNSNRNQTHKGEANAIAPDSLFAHKPMLDQTIPLRVPAEIKAALVALAQADRRSLNSFLNIKFQEMIDAATPVRMVCQNTHTPAVLDIPQAESEWHGLAQVEPATPHKATIRSKPKAKAKAKPKAKARK